jgi:hypothetical protein
MLDGLHLALFTEKPNIRVFGHLGSDDSKFGHLASDHSRFDFNLTKQSTWDPVWNSEIDKIFDFLKKVLESRNETETFPFDNVGHIYTDVMTVISGI